MEPNALMELIAIDVDVDQATLERTVKLKLMNARVNLVLMEACVLTWLLDTNVTVQEDIMGLDVSLM